MALFAYDSYVCNYILGKGEEGVRLSSSAILTQSAARLMHALSGARC